VGHLRLIKGQQWEGAAQDNVAQTDRQSHLFVAVLSHMLDNIPIKACSIAYSFNLPCLLKFLVSIAAGCSKESSKSPRPPLF
jgi:hypothetical protein